MFNYEKLQEFSLDLIHFGTTPGVYDNEQLLLNVQKEIVVLLTNLD